MAGQIHDHADRSADTVYMFKKGVKNIALNTVCGNSDSPPCERSLYFS